MEINITGIPSLKILNLGFSSEAISVYLSNIEAVTHFSFNSLSTINQSILDLFFGQLQNIENLSLFGNFSRLNLSKLANLKTLNLEGTIKEDFSNEIFRNISQRLVELRISLRNMEEKTLFKLFESLNFPNLLSLIFFDIKNFESVNMLFFERFPKLLDLTIKRCKLKIIEDDTFSKLKYLNNLDLSENSLILLNKRSFSNLSFLQSLNLNYNNLKSLDRDIFIYFQKSINIEIKFNNFPDDYEMPFYRRNHV